MNEEQITQLLIKYNDYLNFEYSQFGLDYQDIEQFLKYYSNK